MCIRVLRKAFILTLGILVYSVFSQPGVENGAITDSVAHLLTQAVENQYRGNYSSDVVFVRESFMRGTDSLRGRLNFNDQTGERQMRLKGGGEAFDWWSRNFGQEQWWRDGNNDRLHRVPFRSFRKPAFESLLTYEDLIKFPADYLLDIQSCQKLTETDSTWELTLLLKAAAQSRYGSFDVVLQKRPVLLRRVVFFGYDGRKLKSLDISAYRSVEGGYLPTGLCIFNGDSLASLRVSLSHPNIISAGRDKTTTGNGVSRAPGQLPNQTRIAPPESTETP